MVSLRYYTAMNTIDYTQVPQMFSLCIHDACPLAKQCLRHMAWVALPASEEHIHIVNPKCTTPSETCRHFRIATPVTYARGFRGMQAQMLPAQYAKFSERLMKHFSRTSFFEHRRGTMLCTPTDIAYIREVLGELGLSDLEFDAYEERYNWID